MKADRQLAGLLYVVLPFFFPDADVAGKNVGLNP